MGLRLLVVDDDPDVLQGTVRILSRAGHEVIQASSGTECLEMARQHQPELILLDIVMPDISGVEVCTRLKSDPDLSRIFVVLLSGSRVSSDDQAVGLERGADGYMTRPIPQRELLARVDAFARLRDAEIERRNSEERLRRAVKDDGLTVMAGGLAHLLNNQLTSVLGYLTLAMESLSPNSPARQDLEMAYAAAQRVAELGRLTLVFSGMAPGVLSVFDLRESVRSVEEEIRPSLADNVEFTVQSGSDQLPIRGDAGQIRDAIRALVLNAKEALENGGGVIRVAADLQLCDVEYLEACWFCEEPFTGEYAALQVADTGCGMDPATLGKAFDPFFSTKFQGRGVGLATVLGVARRHGGAIRVESELGNGSTFVLLLPVTQSNRAMANAAARDG